MSVFNYLKTFLNPTNPTASLRHASFALVVVSGVVWLTIALWRPAGLDANWVASFALLLSAVTVGKIAGQPVDAAASPAGPSAASDPGAKNNSVFASDPNRGQA